MSSVMPVSVGATLAVAHVIGCAGIRATARVAPTNAIGHAGPVGATLAVALVIGCAGNTGDREGRPYE